MLITARKRSLGQGNIFTPVCHSVHKGGMPGCSGGHAWLLWGGWLLQGGVHGCSWGVRGCSWGGACMVALGGMHGCSGGHAWLLPGGCMVALGGMHGCSGGVCGIQRDTEIWSMSGRYASYWNAFLFLLFLLFLCISLVFLIEIGSFCVNFIKDTFRKG